MSIGTGFANSPSSIIHVSDEGDKASQKAVSYKGDLSLDFIDQREVPSTVAASGGVDQQEPFPCIFSSECTIDVLTWLRRDYNIPDDI